MFQKTKRQIKRVFSTKKMQMLTLMLLCDTTAVMVQSSAGDYSADTTVLVTVMKEIVKYVPVVAKLCYAVAGVVAIVGAISAYIATNNREWDMKKKTMTVVGAYAFLTAAARALPMFFGLGTQTSHAMKGKDERYPDYPLFKGLQRSLEFMEIQGRYIYWAAGVASGAITGFIIAYCLAGFMIGLAVLVAAVSAGIAFVMLKQRRGLHTKKDGHRMYIYIYSKKL